MMEAGEDAFRAGRTGIELNSVLVQLPSGSILLQSTLQSRFCAAGLSCETP